MKEILVFLTQAHLLRPTLIVLIMGRDIFKVKKKKAGKSTHHQTELIHGTYGRENALFKMYMHAHLQIEHHFKKKINAKGLQKVGETKEIFSHSTIMTSIIITLSMKSDRICLIC